MRVIVCPRGHQVRMFGIDGVSAGSWIKGKCLDTLSDDAFVEIDIH